MNRREFLALGSAAATAGAIDRRTEAASPPRGPERLRIGIMSDIHLQTQRCVEDRIRPSFEYFRDRDVDGVMIAGDLTDWGQKAQLKMLADAWHSVFPGDRHPSGKKVERLFIYGNHDIEGWRYDYRKWEKLPKDYTDATGIGSDRHRAEFWEEIFGEKWAPIVFKDVKGYKFVLANYGGWRFFHFDDIVGLPEMLAAHDEELRNGRPFFYSQHLLLRNTSTAPWCRWVDSGKTTRLLSKYPNCVAITGHTHVGLADDHDLWRGQFTGVGASTTWNLHKYGGRENSRLSTPDNDLGEQMPDMEIKGQHGLVLHVHDDALVFERYDFLTHGKIGPDWVVPWPPKPATDEERRAAVPVPQFPKDAKVAFWGIHGRDRAGRPTDQVVVKFPNVGPGSARAFDYEVTAEVLVDDAQYAWRTKRVFSAAFQQSQAADVQPITCVFASSELPAANRIRSEMGRRFRFVVSPVNSFGVKGRAICSQWTALENIVFT